jgi:hypothetical protein
MSVRESGDAGQPIALEATDQSLASKTFHEIAAKLTIAVPLS